MHGGMFGVVGVSVVMAGSIAAGMYVAFVNGMFSISELGGVAAVVGVAFLLIQGIYVSSTMFGAEIHGKTYPLLALLPWSKHRLAYSKLIGAFLFVFPALICALLGLLVTIVPATTSMSESLALTVVHAIPQCVLYYYLVVYFSFKVRFGSFVVAAFVLGAIQVFMGFPMMLLLLITNAVMSSVGGGFIAGFAAVLLNAAYSIFVCGLIIAFIHRLISFEIDHAAGA